MSHHWCRVLAESEYHHGKWLIQPTPETYQQKLYAAMDELSRTAADAIAVFNHHSSPEAYITLMTLDHTESGDLRGFVLFRFSTQIRLLYEGQYLTMTLIKTESYQPKQKAQVKLMVQPDDLNEITWLTPNGQLWDQHQLIKAALKELVKYSHPPV